MQSLVKIGQRYSVLFRREDKILLLLIVDRIHPSGIAYTDCTDIGNFRFSGERKWI